MFYFSLVSAMLLAPKSRVCTAPLPTCRDFFSLTIPIVTTCLSSALTVPIRSEINMTETPEQYARTPQLATNHFQDVRQWIDNCATNHEQCRLDTNLKATLSRLKLIDCATRTIVSAPQKAQYVALSYVWGSDQTAPSLGGQLPQTIEDSITTTLLLGCKHLWVDRYVRLL
jgi:hypothetical protein